MFFPIVTNSSGKASVDDNVNRSDFSVENCYVTNPNEPNNKYYQKTTPETDFHMKKNVGKSEHHLNDEDIDETSNVVYEEVFWNV